MPVRKESGLGVDHDAAVPLYHQIFLALRDEVVSGKRRHGSAMPTEAELSAALGVSRITARRALQELAQQGLVERRRRTGTRVAYRNVTSPLEGSVEQAIDTLIAFGRKTRVRVDDLSKLKADSEVAQALAVPLGAGVLRSVRTRFMDGEPLGEVIAHVPEKIGAGLTRAKLSKTPILELLRAAGYIIADASQTITAELADAGLARRLGIEPRAPILAIRRIVYGAEAIPLMLTEARYRGDRYRVSLDFAGRGRRIASPQ